MYWPADVPGTPYGNLYKPVNFGSGVSHGTHGVGGGILNITVETRMIVDGTISVNGNSHSDSSYGGGSGGSIWITTDEMEGHGVIQVRYF